MLYLIFISLLAGACHAQESVPMRDIEILRLHANEKTAHRRVDAVSQVRCRGFRCRHYHNDDVVCKNRGWDGTQVIWECRTRLKEGYILTDATVECEGYKYKGDPNVLIGSCGVIFSVQSSTGPGAAMFHAFLILFVIAMVFLALYALSKPRYYSALDSVPRWSCTDWMICQMWWNSQKPQSYGGMGDVPHAPVQKGCCDDGGCTDGAGACADCCGAMASVSTLAGSSSR